MKPDEKHSTVGAAPNKPEREISKPLTVSLVRRRFWTWLKQGSPFFLFVFGISAAFGTAILMASPDNLSILRNTGTMLQVFGWLVLFVGLIERQDIFQKAPWHRRALAWLASFPTIFSRPKDIVVGIGGASLGISASGAAISVRPSTLEGRVQHLEEELRELRSDTRQRFNKEAEERQAAIRRARTELQAEVRSLRESVEHAAVSSLDIELVGAFWVALGILMSGL